MNISIKRVYDEPAANDGMRVLVDRLWPRGLSKDEARVDLWLKAIAPSNDLRKWFQHDHEKWPEFKKRYFAELDANGEAVQALKQQIKGHKNVVFLFSAKEPECNNAEALKEYLAGKK